MERYVRGHYLGPNSGHKFRSNLTQPECRYDISKIIAEK